MSDITFTKGSNSVSIEVNNVAEEFKNKLITLTLTTSGSNQSGGAKATKVVDLLRITQQYVIKGYITAEDGLTAKQKVNKLKLIANGSGENGGTTTMTYDGDSITGYIESITITKEADDSVNETSIQVVKYQLAITFVKGVSAIS